MLRLAREHAAEIDRRYPKILRRVDGLQPGRISRIASKPVNLAKIMVGSEGTLGVVLEAKLRLVPLPKAKAVMVISFADLLEALAAAPVILRHEPSAVEVMDKSILDNTRQNAVLDNIRTTFIAGDPEATLCVEFYGDRKEDLPPRLSALEQDLRSRKLGYQYRSETELAGQARIWSLREAALGLSMAMKERGEVDPVRRRHRGGAGEAERIHRPLSGRSCAATIPPPGFMRMLRWDACTCVPSST